MKRLFSLSFAILASLQLHAAQDTFVVPPGTTLTYTNDGVITTPPHIDAINFINFGEITISTIGPSTPLPYETYDTLNYTNYGIIQGSSGFRFNLVSNATGRRHMSANFVNANGGLVSALDPTALAYYTGGACSVAAVDPSYLIVHATNIMNGGGLLALGSAMNVGPNGLLELRGENVNLSYSSLEVMPVWATPLGDSVGNPRTNFVPDIALYDALWAQDSFSDQTRLNFGSIWDGTVATAQNVPVETGAAGLTPDFPFSLINPISDSRVGSDMLQITVTNEVGEVVNVTLRSNVVKQAIFVGVPPGFGAIVGFGGAQSFPAANRYQSAHVTLTVGIPNAVTGLPDPAGLSILDELASDTRLRGLSANALYCASPPTSRPQSFLLSRLDLGTGSPGLGVPDSDFFLSSAQMDPNVFMDEVTNSFVTQGDYAVYGAYADNVVSHLPSLAGAAISNMPGRVVIDAKNLDLTETRIRGEGLVKITTPNLISSSNAVIDAEHISYDLDSQGGLLKIQNLVPDSVARFRGTITSWSAIWSNSVQLSITNYTVEIETDPADTNVVTTNVTFAPIMATVNVEYHALLVDATQLGTALPVNVHQFTSRTADTLIEDNMSVLQEFQLRGRSLTVNGSLVFPGAFPVDPLTGVASIVEPIRNFTFVNAPNLFYLTNNGMISVPNEGHFGDDRPPYAALVNRGSLSAAGLSLRSEVLENSGQIAAIAALHVQAREGKLDGGSSSAGTFVEFRARNLRINNHTIDSGVGPLNFYVTNLFADAGEGSGNIMRTGNGFHLRVKPEQGDLLGTRLQTHAGTVGTIQIFHTWAAEDRGASPAGYINNAALGTLALSSEADVARFVFSGTGGNNAIYVDLLDLSQLSADFLNEIQINGNFAIYFAAAQLPNGAQLPPNTQPEEFLDGKLNGRLRWVSSFAGPNSSQATLVNGQPVLVNRALLNSRLIDSDKDGVANFFDGAGPNGDVFQLAPISVTVAGNGTVLPMVDGQSLIVGQQYTLVADPADGSGFFGWSGSLSSEQRALSFVMEPGFSVVASFSFQPEAASFNGIFFDSDGITIESSGAITLKTTSKGRFSGKIESAFGRRSFSGTLDESGFAEVFASPFFITFQVQSDEVTGTVEGDDWVAEFVAPRAVFDKKTRPAQQFAGTYTIVFPGAEEVANTVVPLGDGFATVSVDSIGRVKMKGTLADGTKISKAAVLSQSGDWPFYVLLHKGGGHLVGWLRVGEQGDRDIGGTFNWIKEASNARFYPEGFEHTAQALGSKLNPAAKPPLGFNEGLVQLVGADFATVLEEPFMTQGKRIVGTGNNKLSLNASSKGTFKGSIVNPATGKKAAFNGVILQKQGRASGFVLGTEKSGHVSVLPE